MSNLVAHPVGWWCGDLLEYIVARICEQPGSGKWDNGPLPGISQ